jgi:hypothetical protein
VNGVSHHSSSQTDFPNFDFGNPYNLRTRHPAMPDSVVRSTVAASAAWSQKVKITRLLVAFFILFGSAMPLSHAGNQQVSAAKLSPVLDCCNPCPPLCPPR